MSYQHHQDNWHLLADRFIWYDSEALKNISEGITDDEIQKYLYTYHGDYMPLEEIRNWREGKQVVNND